MNSMPRRLIIDATGLDAAWQGWGRQGVGGTAASNRRHLHRVLSACPLCKAANQGYTDAARPHLSEQCLMLLSKGCQGCGREAGGHLPLVHQVLQRGACGRVKVVETLW